MTGWGTIDADRFIELLRHLVDMDADPFLMTTVIHRVDPDGFAARSRVTGVFPAGGPFEMMFETVGVVRDGRVQRLELQ